MATTASDPRYVIVYASDTNVDAEKHYRMASSGAYLAASIRSLQTRGKRIVRVEEQK